MDRERARKIITGLFDQAVDDIDTERLESMKRELQAQMQTARQKGLYEKVVNALDAEITARKEGEKGAAGDIHIHPQTPAEARAAGYPGDEPGELRHGAQREASEKWRVVGR